MRRFILDIIIFILLTCVFAELVARIFDLKCDHSQFFVEDEDGYYANQINTEGNYVFGKYPSIYRSKFRFNDVGFNSELDYKNFDKNRINVVFLGDSYVESFHVNIDKSFSSQLMKHSSKIQSFDFGISGYNIEDYRWLYDKYGLENFDYIFIILKMNDIVSSPNRKKYNAKKEAIRKIYNSLEFFNYLNLNHHVVNNLVDIITNKKDDSSKDDQETVDLSIQQRSFLEKGNIYLLPRDEESILFFKKEGFNNVIEIDHRLKPISFGTMNDHWNENGRLNVINSVISYIDLD